MSGMWITKRILHGLGLLALVGLVLAGCSGKAGMIHDAAKIKQRCNETRMLQREISLKGGEVCGTEELALAESNRTFAVYELEQANTYGYNRHMDLARDYAEKAYDEAKRCGPDRDEDGVLDMVDQCPDDPEDRDGWQDEDGCPDVDNDADGFLDQDDQCPDDAEDQDNFEDDDGCPDPDNDADGILDDEDQCPNEPEDIDNWQDDDGCPDPDNDADGLLDTEDQCPNEPESFNGNEDEDGCPDELKYSLVNVTDTKIELRQMVFFKTGKALILPKSYALLNEVARVLKDYPKMKVQVEGHTDSVGRDSSNQRLSQQRAESVRNYLIGKGVAAERMTPKGFGESQPIASNKGEKGRSKNRRVEFMILDR